MKAESRLSTVEDFYRIVLEPSCKESIENSFSIRHAILASLSIYHITEWIEHSLGSTNKNQDFREKINNKCSDIKIIREIINNIKHPKPETSRHISFNSNTEWITDHWHDTAFPNTYTTVSFEGCDCTHNLSKIIEKCFNFWEKNYSIKSFSELK